MPGGCLEQEPHVNDGTPVVDSGKIGDARSKVSDVPRYQVSTYTGGDPR